MSLKDLENLVGSDQTGTTTDRPVVVVIDDDIGIRNALARVLTRKYVVRKCADGVQGLDQSDRATSCVILDVRMPRHDGFWVFKQLRKKAPDVPIIFHSAYHDTKAPHEILNELQPFGFVVKGETITELLSLVAKAVEHAAHLKEGGPEIDPSHARRKDDEQGTTKRRSIPVTGRRSTPAGSRRSAPAPAGRSTPPSVRRAKPVSSPPR